LKIAIDSEGNARCLYTETMSLEAIGHLDIRRASHVEPNSRGEWIADLAPVQGPELGPYPSRSAALRAEADWLESNRI
jgi:hypothetical protein